MKRTQSTIRATPTGPHIACKHQVLTILEDSPQGGFTTAHIYLEDSPSASEGSASSVLRANVILLPRWRVQDQTWSKLRCLELRCLVPSLKYNVLYTYIYFYVFFMHVYAYIHIWIFKHIYTCTYTHKEAATHVWTIATTGPPREANFGLEKTRTSGLGRNGGWGGRQHRRTCQDDMKIFI